MPKVHFVKKARKGHPKAGIKAGESYYWWKPKVGGRGGAKRFSKTRPKPSQLTQSEFYAEVYSIQEEMADAAPEDFDDLTGMAEDWVSRIEQIGEECRTKFDNLPDGLQQGETGQLLEERADAMEQWASDIQGVDLDWSPEDAGEEDAAEAMKAALQERLDEILSQEPSV